MRAAGYYSDADNDEYKQEKGPSALHHINGLLSPSLEDFPQKKMTRFKQTLGEWDGRVIYGGCQANSRSGLNIRFESLTADLRY